MPSVREQMEAMIAGTHEDVIEAEENTQEKEVETSTADIEDTDQATETESEKDTDTPDDDQKEETEEEDVTVQEEHTQEEDTDNKPKEELDTADKTAETEPADEVNYKEFYEKVALAKFTANGKEVEGFKNPEDLIRAQQMLHGYSDKMRVFKEYKKFLKPLEERKITQDPEKFNLALSVLDGDVEAIKKVIKEKGINPLEFDMDEINYAPKNTLPSDAQMLIEEYGERAKELGVEEKFYNVLTKDFDNASVNEFIKDAAVRNDLMKHLANGVYDVVQNEMRKMELLDVDNTLGQYSTVDKYRIAVKRLAEAQVKKAQPTQTPEVKGPDVKAIAAEKERIEKAQADAEAKRKAAEKEKEVAEQRKKAASVSKTKPVKKVEEKPKPEALRGDEFRNYFKQMMMN